MWLTWILFGSLFLLEMANNRVQYGWFRRIIRRVETLERDKMDKGFR